jgi:hypothetical protein
MSSERWTIKFDFHPKEPFTIFALQIGGFLPLCFSGADLVLVDRNVISNASNIRRGGSHPHNEANAWWHSFINDPRLLINPVLAAVEGSKRSIPTFDEFCNEFDRCSEVLKQAFPKARIVEYNQAAYQVTYSLVEGITGDYEAEVAFLQAAMPMVTTRNPKHRLGAIEKTLLDCAKRAGLKRPTLSLIACLSCLYESATKKTLSPGRLILKPKKIYTRVMAHNAIMDLCALQFLIQGSIKLNPNMALCTSDKGLLKFWCALNIKPGDGITAEGFNFNLELSEEMFPSLDKCAILGLKQRVETNFIQ